MENENIIQLGCARNGKSTKGKIEIVSEPMSFIDLSLDPRFHTHVFGTKDGVKAGEYYYLSKAIVSHENKDASEIALMLGDEEINKSCEIVLMVNLVPGCGFLFHITDVPDHLRRVPDWVFIKSVPDSLTIEEHLPF